MGRAKSCNAPRFGMRWGSSVSSSPSRAATKAKGASKVTTSIWGLSFWARSFAKFSPLRPVTTRTRTLFSRSNAWMTLARHAFSKVPPNTATTSSSPWAATRRDPTATSPKRPITIPAIPRTHHPLVGLIASPRARSGAPRCGSRLCLGRPSRRSASGARRHRTERRHRSSAREWCSDTPAAGQLDVAGDRAGRNGNTLGARRPGRDRLHVGVPFSVARLDRRLHCPRCTGGRKRPRPIQIRWCAASAGGVKDGAGRTGRIRRHHAARSPSSRTRGAGERHSECSAIVRP